MSNKMILAGAAMLLSLGATAPVLAQGEGVVPQNENIRAIEPPVDVTPQQLRAQRGIAPPVTVEEGRSVAIVPPVLVPPVFAPAAPVYPQGVEPAIPGAGEPDR